VTGFETNDNKKLDIFYEQLHFLQREEKKQSDLRRIQEKYLYLQKISNLKVKGRFLEET
jgi:hypothetical protein